MKKPFCILLGGASGVGHSSISRLLSKRLHVTHILETDYIREVLRSVLDKDYSPMLHESSYTAWRILRKAGIKDHSKQIVTTGFVEHVNTVAPSIENVVIRAGDDASNIIVEGVHLVPGLINVREMQKHAKISFFIITCQDEKEHYRRFRKRGRETKRSAERHISHFKEIRMIQDFLIYLAKKHNVPIVDNIDLEKTVRIIVRKTKR